MKRLQQKIRDLKKNIKSVEETDYKVKSEKHLLLFRYYFELEKTEEALKTMGS